MRIRRTHGFWRATALAAILAGLFWLTLARTQAAGVVTNCTGNGLANAMNSGSGLITFSCGPNPVVLTVTQAGGFNVIPGRFYTIDGGDKVTLTGAHANRLFDVQTNGALTLTHIILTDGYQASGGNNPTQGGAIRLGGNWLALDHVTIRNSAATFSAGAIEAVNGAMFIQDSLIEDNQSDYGGAIDSLTAVTMFNTIVQRNHATGHNGGALDVSGNVVISNSQILNNTSAGNGGGINTLGSLTLVGSTVSANTASVHGAGLFITGTATLDSSTIGANTSDDYGAGIYNGGTTFLSLSVLNGNRAAGLGGGLYNQSTAYFSVYQSTVDGNIAFDAAGLYNDGELAVDHSTLSHNIAQTGNLGSGGGLYNHKTARLSNSTISGNFAADDGGGLYNEAVMSLLNMTLSNNTAFAGGALYNESGKTIVLTNTILAYSPSGGNCVGTLTAYKFTLSSDNSCALSGLINGHSPNGLDPLLTALGNYGGPAAGAGAGSPTLVHMLEAGSPAIAGVIGNDAPLDDQRNQPRPGGDGSYDLGAVERQGSETSLAPRLYLPLLLR